MTFPSGIISWALKGQNGLNRHCDVYYAHSSIPSNLSGAEHELLLCYEINRDIVQYFIALYALPLFVRNEFIERETPARKKLAVRGGLRS